jgi:arsenate reductase-like glutaredoxin family protein
MQAEPTLIKRPVLEVNKRVHVGFTAADYQQLFS